MGERSVSLLGFVAYEALSQGIKTAFDSLGMPFQGGLPPPMITFFIADLDKEPTRKDTKILDCLDLWHNGGSVARRFQYEDENEGAKAAKRNRNENLRDECACKDMRWDREG